MTQKFKREEGYTLCERINGGECHCRKTSSGPCASLVPILRSAAAEKIDAVEYEKSRVDRAYQKEKA